MKVQDLLEASINQSGTIGQMIDAGLIDANIQDRVLSMMSKKFDQEYIDKIKADGTLDKLMKDFRNLRVSVKAREDGTGEMTFGHPSFGKVRMKINLDVGDGSNPRLTGIDTSTQSPGTNYWSKGTSYDKDELDNMTGKARAAADAELTRQGVNPRTGTRN